MSTLRAYGGSNSSMGKQQLKRATHHVKQWNPNSESAWVHVHSNGHVKYVRTVADDRNTGNLLALPEK
jgi:hypothetical protein